MRGMTCVACKAQLGKLSPSALAPALAAHWARGWHPALLDDSCYAAAILAASSSGFWSHLMI